MTIIVTIVLLVQLERVLNMTTCTCMYVHYTMCSTSELVNYIFLWVPTHIGLSYTSNYRYTNVNLVPINIKSNKQTDFSKYKTCIDIENTLKLNTCTSTKHTL